MVADNFMTASRDTKQIRNKRYSKSKIEKHVISTNNVTDEVLHFLSKIHDKDSTIKELSLYFIHKRLILVCLREQCVGRLYDNNHASCLT